MPTFFERFLKHFFVLSVVITALGAAFSYGVIAHRSQLPPIPQLRTINDMLRTIEGAFDDDILDHLQPSRGQGDGIVVNTTPNDGALVFLAGFFDDENQIRLIERDGTLVKSWSLNYLEHFSDAAARSCNLSSPLKVDIHGAVVTPQGEVVLNYEYCGTVKLDQCGDLMWRIGQATHHSIVPAEEGGYWVLGRHKWPASAEPNRFPPFSNSSTMGLMLEDTIIKVGENGTIITEFSIPQLMRDNGLEYLLTAIGGSFTGNSKNRRELVHANKVAELSSEIADAHPLFEAGDLAVSMRGLNLIIVLDPTTKKVKWHQTGPWLRQHDPEFRSDGRISIFNNNVYRTAYDNKGQTIINTPHTTNIIAVDPVSRETEVLFGEKDGQEMLSVIRGQHEILPENGIIITEFDAGRVLEVDGSGEIIWEYVNRYNDKFVGEITNSAVYPAGFFKTNWKTCRQ